VGLELNHKNMQDIAGAIGIMAGYVARAADMPLAGTEDLAANLGSYMKEGGDAKDALIGVLQVMLEKLKPESRKFLPPEELRDLIFNFILAHETVGCNFSPPRETCWSARCHLMAYFCHSLCIQGDRLHREVSAALDTFNQKCVDPTCQHHRN
jgi:hypothetical protein